MPRAQVQVQSASEGSDSDGSDSSYSDSSSEDDSNNSESTGDEEEEEEEEEADAEAKKQRVRADIDEMRHMMADMDTIKARLQQRFASERQAWAEEIAREDREREAKDAARRKAEEEARGRQVDAGMQTEPQDLQQQINVSHQMSYRSHGNEAVGDAKVLALPAVDGGAGFIDAIPNKPRPAGLSLYDLVKAPEFGLSRKMHSPVHQAESSEELPMRPSKENDRVLIRESPEQMQHQGQDTTMIEQSWRHDGSHLNHDQDSVVDSSVQDSVVGSGGDDSESDICICPTSPNASSLSPVHHRPSQPKHQQPLQFSGHFDENSASVSNSLVSSIADNQSAVFPDPSQRQKHKFNAAALISTEKRPPPSTTKEDDSVKTDDQREMEAIQCLLFDR
ncbi:hypothetical protein P3T76_008682 [Phytophthora citrophthora]|uniref:Uncharacterized protein n=1 Tax=Phytophthora citrophthora TaxID=4793 RepID=A0AAD9GJ55_9STRA|nr:hypothetical protein P3T76_008682 [Phytophthora citrophthora]